MLRVTKAIIDDNREWLKGWLTATFDVEVSDKLLGEWLKAARPFVGAERFASEKPKNVLRRGYGWSIVEGLSRTWLREDYADDDWRMWFSNRLREVGKWPSVGCGSMFLPHFGCDFNVFFVHLEETPEMLERLRKVEPATKSGPSSPGIERTQVKLKPIDRVASRVVPKE